VVTRDSAKLGAAHEVCRDLNRDHRDICKFASRGSAYEKVQGNLRDIVVSPALISVGVTPPSSRDQASVCIKPDFIV
jgi:hypothetical protein